ncbi:DUF305 domain-containing protein [Saccharothrix sp. NPDC042600]|uniref:DUF305 domain-containing protein n=1 Tax=Saccharothrix TaxID=2071 RepID=UPI003407D520|nr:DUF305 domain-containing protein [Saccharothrix mutabilis subsp. capreolus]
MTSKNLVGTALAALTAGVVLAGCGGSDSGSHGTTHTTTTTAGTTASASTERNDADIAFAQGMVPHHEGAIEMSGLARGRTTNPKVLDLAARIERAQDPEIKTMTAWLTAWGAAPTGEHDGHGTSMPGMMSHEEMEKLKQAKDADFDKLFLEGMVKHHQGAIDMANTELRQGVNAEAKKLAQQIIEAQQKEIDEMNALLRG